ncbi:DNA transposase [Frankliniella fusca]|uniref:DNA transposase n=1 Tax=Frankliniella fusca TaxID=407009 RepID=A0AAE1I1C6_9NEOP|nr:DNA transposase [Frankliniella fusca]
MGRTCVVPSCTTGSAESNRAYKSKGLKPPTLYTCKLQSILPLWQKALAAQNYTKVVDKTTLVCALHFAPKDIDAVYKVVTPSGEQHSYAKTIPTLKPNAVPIIFGIPPISPATSEFNSPQTSNAPQTTTTTSTPVRSQYVFKVPKPVKLFSPSPRSSPSKTSPRVIVHSQPPPSSRARLFEPSSPLEPPSTSDTGPITLAEQGEPLAAPVTEPVTLSEREETQADQLSPETPSCTVEVHALVHSPPSSDRIVRGARPKKRRVLTDVDSIEFVSSEIVESPMFNILSVLHQSAHTVKLPGDLWGVHTNGIDFTIFCQVTAHMAVVKAVKITDSIVPQLFIHGSQCFNVSCPPLKQKSDIEKFLQHVHGMQVCAGCTDSDMKPDRSKHCMLLTTTKRCQPCVIHRKLIQRKEKESRGAMDKLRDSMRKAKRKLKTVSTKNKGLAEDADNLRSQILKVKRQTIEDLIKELPEQQQLVVRTCFDTSKCKKQGRRYTTEWIYECLLMRISAPKLYRRLCEDNKLPLPHLRTLRRYMKNISPTYGFNENILQGLSKRSEGFSEAERHGCLLLDEMALDENVKYDPASKQFQGVVDLGKYTKEEDRTKRGNHALVIMFQPFRGKWVQTIGAFLSRGACRGQLLQKIIVEAVGLIEQTGFKVDVVTTDGATWNRSMWKAFGLTMDENSCEHPVDQSRKLMFASDFPHLVKGLWTRMLNKKQLNTPDGLVNIHHWKVVHENEAKKGIKGNFTLSEDHLHPTNFQKMNVRLGMQFYGARVADAMEHLKEQGVHGLADSEPTIKFIRRINSLVDALNSRSPSDGLKADPENKHNKTLVEFLDYLYQMEEIARSREVLSERLSRKAFSVGENDELSASCFLGLLVTIKTALQLVEYLTDSLDYSYLMTRRINQDALEHFFGHIRSACGSNNHPDPIMFIQVYRLLCTYSLIKPPRGSNVSGADMLETLLKLKDTRGEDVSKKKVELESMIDMILDGDLPFLEEEVSDFELLQTPIDHFALTVFAGYISRKILKMKPANECEQCASQLILESEEDRRERETLLEIRTRGGLLRPSDTLFDLTFKLETAVLRVTEKTEMHADLLFTVLDRLLWSPDLNLPLIGEFNRAAAAQKKLKRNLAKTAKLA